jgi:hypothetical protein
MTLHPMTLLRTAVLPRIPRGPALLAPCWLLAACVHADKDEAGIDTGDPGTDTADTDTSTLPEGPVVDLATSLMGSCAVYDDGEVWCWGGLSANTGVGAFWFLPGPRRVDGLEGVASMDISRGTYCATFTEGGSACWDGTAWVWDPDADTFTFSEPTYPRVEAERAWASDWAMLWLLVTGEGVFDYRPPGTPESLFTDAVELSMSTSLRRCALDGDGAVRCTDVAGGEALAIPPMVNVASGFEQSCGLGAAGDVWCWGPDDDGEPVQAVAEGAAALTVGQYRACVLTDAGTASCWGDNATEDLTGLDDLVTISGDELHTCAADVDGGVWCWGANDDGQLGNQDATRGPVRVEGLR